MRGKRVCYYHGGKSPGRPPKHGFVARLTPEEQERYDALRASLDCSHAWAYVQAKLECGRLERADLEDDEVMAVVTGMLARQAQTARNIKETLQGQVYRVQVADGAVMERIVEVLQRYVPRDKWSEAIAELRQCAGS